MNVLLSIKPKYVKQILNGNKKYEFRKSAFRSYDNLDKVYIYSSSPVKRIVAVFTIKAVIEDHPDKLWKQCKDFSGIEETEFFDYFKGKNKGVAIKIGEIEVFDPINPEDFFPDFVPPQSFYYIDKDFRSI